MKILQIFFFFYIASTVAQTAPPLQIVLANVHFPANASTINPEAAHTLDAVAALLQATPTATVELGVHTDASGSTSYNLRLSQQRASAVGGYLTKKGVAAKRVKPKGYGESKPLNRCRRGTRCTEDEKRQNRRVELRVQGLPADSAILAPWRALGSLSPTARRPPPTAENPPVPTVSATSVPIPPSPVQHPVSTDASDKPSAPKPLPGTFTGYTVEITCADKPLAAEDVLLRKHDLVFVRQVPGGPYCYYVGAFFTLPEARQFLAEKIQPALPDARVVGFSQDSRKYFEN